MGRATVGRAEIRHLEMRQQRWFAGFAADDIVRCCVSNGGARRHRAREIMTRSANTYASEKSTQLASRSHLTDAALRVRLLRKTCTAVGAGADNRIA